MARNKYPEETVRRILETAARLFAEKGYDKTSLQDIIDETKLSKGAIYHHFASKEEIFIKICDRIGEENANDLAKVCNNSSLNGAQKLKEIFRAAVNAPNQLQVLDMIPYLIDSPKFLAIQLRTLYDEVVPFYIQPILEEGMKDGSIQAEHPKALAEVIIILSNIWLHPLLKPSNPEDMRARCEVMIQIMQGIGLDIIDEEMVEIYVDFAKRIQKRKNRMPE